jgi:hypothetical protein
MVADEDCSSKDTVNKKTSYNNVDVDSKLAKEIKEMQQKHDKDLKDMKIMYENMLALAQKMNAPNESKQSTVVASSSPSQRKGVVGELSILYLNSLC